MLLPEARRQARHLVGGAGYRFYLCLALAPIIRILSLAIPMWNFPVMYWYLITGAPLLLTAFVIIRVVGYRSADVCLRWGRPLEQAGVALVGFPLGWIEYQILRPASLLPGGSVKMLLLGGIYPHRVHRLHGGDHLPRHPAQGGR